jgi:predicted aspartyl protease
MDSGSSEAVMPYEVASELGLRGIVQTRVDAAGNRPVRATVVEIPELVLGDLVVRKVLAAAMPSSIMTIVGQSILRHAPWAISWDRGTLTLGAAPWPMAGDVVAVPLHRTPRNPGDEIEVRINGHLVRMLLDTGAAESALPADVAAPLGLSPGTSSRAVLDLGGVARLAHSYWGALQIGPISIEHQRFNELPRGKTALLGLDVLSRFELLVVPGQRLLLRQRRDPRATAAERIRRWAWLPSCASPACVRARLEPWGRNGNGQLQLDIEAELPRPVHLYVGCASGEAVRGLLFVDLVVVKPGQMTADIWLGGSNWFSPQGLRCRDLKVLDVIPAPDLRSGSPGIHARLEEEP